jgi:hypothetical protein
MSISTGACVEVYWRRYSRYFKGIVSSISAAGLHTVNYDDGDRREYKHETEGELHYYLPVNGPHERKKVRVIPQRERRQFILSNTTADVGILVSVELTTEGGGTRWAEARIMHFKEKTCEYEVAFNSSLDTSTFILRSVTEGPRTEQSFIADESRAGHYFGADRVERRVKVLRYGEQTAAGGADVAEWRGDEAEPMAEAEPRGPADDAKEPMEEPLPLPDDVPEDIQENVTHDVPEDVPRRRSRRRLGLTEPPGPEIPGWA